MSEGRVVIVAADPGWPAAFEAEAALIRAAVGHVLARIEHIGSTAVPGLAAKPIIDLMAGLHRLGDADAVTAPLAALGYQYVPEFEAELPGRRYFRKAPAGGPGYHLHLWPLASEAWARHLLFRDYLRAHADEAARYAALKYELAARFADDRDGYTHAKGEYIARVTALARFRPLPAAGARSGGR
jgi:GrpB-like predicted nucleotidyltransferase (UPF0157 family)